MKLESLVTYLINNGISDVFIYDMPSTVSDGVLLAENLSGTPIDVELPQYRETGFQAIIRGSEYVATKALANTVSNLLTLETTSLTGMLINFVRPKHEPVAFPRTEGGNIEFSVNFEANYVLTE